MYRMFNSPNVTVELLTGFIIKRDLVRPILVAIEQLLGRNYHDYVDFVEFCEVYADKIIANPEITLSLNDFSSWLEQSQLSALSNQGITAEDIVNVTLSAVDLDMVMRSPYREDRRARQAFAAGY